MSVKVGVRVRPFNKREQALKDCRCCVQMEGPITHLIDDEGNKKSFGYDHSFWSHDKYTIDPDGIYTPVDDKYADQKRVYQQIGSSILVNAWQGYNCCLFAYGQTGAGKSYSMLGYGANKGIVPMVCEQIFKKIKNTKEQNKSYQITVSMMQIYNETIKDLLCRKDKQNQLKICQSKKHGVYVDGLEKHRVNTYNEIERKLEEGSNNRSIAATLMNQNSSRSHTIFSINFIQKTQVTKSQTSFKYSVIHLVDLAGSQCVAKTGAITKDRLRQAGKINQSLSTLGRVIQILADNASKTNKDFVPYRDSKLTFILRNALGGNSQTTMVCAISPSNDNYQQTLSTLRYAHRAKKIQNSAIINQSDVDKLIRMLREENQMLKKMLKDAKWNKNYINQIHINQQNNNNLSNQNSQYDQQQIIDFDNIQEINLLEQQQNMSPSSKQQKQIISYFPSPIENKINQQQPYITNISEDQFLSFRVKYSCLNLTIGNKFGDPKPDVILAALGITPHHAKIWIENKQVFIQPLEEASSDYLFCNGENVLIKKKLNHLDRIIFGTGCVFLAIIPDSIPKKPIQRQQIDYQFAINEMNAQGLNRSFTQQSQIRKKILEQIEDEYEKNKKQNQEKLAKHLLEQEQNFNQKLKEVKEASIQQSMNLKQKLLDKQKQANALSIEKKKAAQEVQKYRLLEQQLKKQKLQKQEYEKTVKILNEKMAQVKSLENKLLEVNKKQEEFKTQILKNEEYIKRQLHIKTIMCTNENLLNQYKLQTSKKSKNAQQLRQLFIKKQKIQLQKQLVLLVPMVQKFNLIAKQMNKRVQCGLSVQYKYISEAEIPQVIKNNAYKGKFTIIIHVINREEGRGYYWQVDVFKNRFLLAEETFEAFINNPNDPKLLDKQLDPYYDPPQFQVIGTGFLMLQCILYKLSFKGTVHFISHKRIIGSMDVHLFPCNDKGQQISLDAINDIQLQAPRQLLEKSIKFCIIISNLQIKKRYDKVVIQYELSPENYKKVKYRTQQTTADNIKYRYTHTIKQLTQNTLFQLSEKPLTFRLKAWPQVSGECLTERSNASSFGDKTEQNNSATFDINEFVQVSPPKKTTTKVFEKGIVFDNNQILDRLQKQYNQKKSIVEKKKQRQSQWKATHLKSNTTSSIKKQKQCIIY